MMLLEPSGVRWLNETWLKVDRGVSFYNTSAIPLDLGFVISRLAFVALGLGAVALSRWHFARTLSGHASRVSPETVSDRDPGSRRQPPCWRDPTARWPRWG